MVVFKKALFILLILPFYFQANAQKAKLDSLKELLPTLSPSIERVNTLNYLALRLSANNVEKANQYALEAIALAQKLGYKKGLAKAFNARAVVNRIIGNHDLALEDFLEALAINQSIQDTAGMAQTTNGIGALYMLTKDYESALEHFTQGLHFRTVLTDTGGMAVALSNMGNASEKLGKLKEALDYHQTSIKYDLQRGDEFSTSYSLHSMGLIYEQQNLLTKAEEHLKKALSLRKEANHNYGIAETSLALGKLLFRIKKYSEAKWLLVQAEEKSQQLNVSSIWLEAIKYQAEISLKEGNTTLASHLFRKYAIEKDSVFNLEKQQQFERLKIRYELDREEQENELLKKDKLIQEEQLKKQTMRVWFLASGIAFVSILLLVLYRLYINKQSTNAMLIKLNEELKLQQEEILAQTSQLQEANLEIGRINQNLENLVEKRTKELQETNEELEFYLYHSAHDLRRPITSIRGLVNLAKLTPKDKEAMDLFEKIDITARNMLKMIQKLNMLTEINRHNPKPISICFQELLDELLEEYQQRSEEKNIQWKLLIEPNLLFTSDELLSHVILKNLIENAISFSYKPKSEIVITASIKKGKLACSIKDQGCGIPQEHLPAIFDLYFRATEQSTGNGIGLYLVKTSLEKLDGTIEVESLPRMGTTVTFKI